MSANTPKAGEYLSIAANQRVKREDEAARRATISEQPEAGEASDARAIVAWLRGRTGAYGGGFTSADDVADAIEREFCEATAKASEDDRDYGQDYPGRVHRSKLPPGAIDRAEAKATGTGQDGPPDVNAGQAAWLDYHFPVTAQDIQAAPSDWATVIDEAVLEPLERELADHHHALSEAVQAEHNRWVEKLRGWIAERQATSLSEHDAATSVFESLAALLAEAEATDAADERRKQESH